MNKIINKIKWNLAKILNVINRFNPFIITRVIKSNVDKIKALEQDIKALEICVNLAKEEHENLKNYHNNLASDFNTYKLDSKQDIGRLFEKINTLNNKVDKHINLSN